jgi:DnaD/phage-associated family protein
MNYIKQINAFWDKYQARSLSDGAFRLYFTLLDLANKHRWPEELVVPNQKISAKFDAERSKLFRCRDRLISEGLILYRKGYKGTAGKYIIVPLYDEGGNIYPAYETSCKFGTNNATNNAINSTTYNATDSENIYKKKKENENGKINEAAATTFPQSDNFPDESVTIFELWQSAGFGGMTNLTMNTLTSYLSLGMEVDCILYAIGEANDNNKRTLSYVRSILNRLQKDGIKTKEQLAKDDYLKRKTERMGYAEQSRKQEDFPPDDYFILNNSWDEI